MRHKDIDLSKYETLKLIGDLCISSRDIVNNNTLLYVDTTYKGLDNVLSLNYDVTLYPTLSLLKWQKELKNENNLYGFYTSISNGRCIFTIVYKIPRCYITDFNLRLKYGLKYVTSTSMLHMITFWGDLFSGHKKSRAVRENSPAYFYFNYLVYKLYFAYIFSWNMNLSIVHRGF